jgi:hypothetical protein
MYLFAIRMGEMMSVGNVERMIMAFRLKHGE